MLHAYTGTSFNNLYPSILNGVLLEGDDVLPPTGHQPKQGQVHRPNREVLNMLIQNLDGRKRINSMRPINIAFALAEVIWILSGRDDVEMVAHYNKQMAAYSDDGDTLHGAYGKRIFMYDQIYDAYQKIVDDPNSRQAVIRINLPELDCNARTKDIPCNVTSMMKLRDGKLNWTQIMRSNDLIWGTPYNFIQFGFLQEVMAGWLGAEVGTYTHYIDSAHIYAEFYDHAAEVARQRSDNRDIHNYYPSSDYRVHYKSWKMVFEIIKGLEEETRKNPNSNLLDYPEMRMIPEGWRNVLLTLGAYNAYRIGRGDANALEMLDSITNEFKPLLARQFKRLPREQRYAGVPVEVLEYVIDPLEDIDRLEKIG